jgi:hypothetical protein
MSPPHKGTLRHQAPATTGQRRRRNKQRKRPAKGSPGAENGSPRSGNDFLSAGKADIAYPGKHLLELARIRAIVGAMSDEEEKAGKDGEGPFGPIMSAIIP